MDSQTKEDQIPNQISTWGIERIKVDFPEWRKEQAKNGVVYSTILCELHAYLRSEVEHLMHKFELNMYNSSAQLMMHIINSNSLEASRIKEIQYCLHCMEFNQDPTPALRLARGERFTSNLHPEYMKKTKCYTNTLLAETYKLKNRN